MASLALPAWTNRQHPIVHSETRHWRRSRVWRTALAVLWGGSLLFLVFPAFCAVLISLQVGYTNLAEAILVAGGTFTFGLTVVSTVAGGLTNLLAGLLGATLIARERECQSWPFLRLTTLTSLEIVGGKLAAVFYSLAGPMHFTAGLRVLALLVGLLTAGLAAAASQLTLDQLLSLWNSLALPLGPLNVGGLLVSGVVGGLLALAGWLLEPYLSVFYNGTVGLAASTLARSRGAAIVLTVAVHIGLGLGLYAPVQQVMSVGMALTLQNANSVTLGLLPVLIVVAPVVAQSLLQAVVVAVCLLFAYNRTEHLSE